MAIVTATQIEGIWTIDISYGTPQDITDYITSLMVGRALSNKMGQPDLEILGFFSDGTNSYVCLKYITQSRA